MKTKAPRISRPKTFVIEGLATCTTCGCTDIKACPAGCTWIKLDREQGTGLCSRCFKGKLPRTKHKPDNRCIYISDRARKTVEFAQAAQPLVDWGVQRLLDMVGEKPSPPPRGSGLLTRRKLKGIQLQIKKQIRQAGSDGGPDRRGSN